MFEFESVFVMRTVFRDKEVRESEGKKKTVTMSDGSGLQEERRDGESR